MGIGGVKQRAISFNDIGVFFRLLLVLMMIC